MGIRPSEPITAMRGTLKIEAAELTESAYRDQREREQVQIACTLKVVSGAGERDGETFNEWFSFPKHEEPSGGSKTGQLLAAALGGDAYGDTPAKEMVPWLVGKTFAAQVGTNKSGKYSRVVHDTITMAPPDGNNGRNGGGGLHDAQQRASDAASGNDPDEEEDFNQIPF